MTAEISFPDADVLMDEARAASGLTDYGDSGDLQTNLARFIEAAAREGRLDEAMARQLRGSIQQRLTNRLEIEAYYKAHPEIEAVEIGPVVSITGLPRTGTTALANIMSLEDQFRPLRSWEQTKCCPPPVAGEEARDPRRLAAVARAEWTVRNQPELAAMHLFDADTTEEDVELLGMSFQAQQLALPIYSYHAWWRQADLRPAFAYHRRALKLLQSRRPPDRWLLKAPAHVFKLDALMGAYPQAKVIMTHRDPAKVIPSNVSLVSEMHAQRGAVDPRELGRQNAEHWRIGMERAMASRARLGEDRFFDLNHRDFVADPFGSLRRVYDFLDLELTPATLARMQAWHAKNRSGAHGQHRYTAEQFGLTTAQLHSDFRAYIERFDVPLEA